jgi:phosphohistidine phosphatase
MKEIARGMLAMELQFGRILSSPYVRARETAEIVGQVFGLEVELWKPLIATANPHQLISHLVRVRENDVLLVGHEPYLSELISVLICGNPEAQIELKKGALCKLRSDHLIYGQCATLEWLLAPSQLRKLH